MPGVTCELGGQDLVVLLADLLLALPEEPLTDHAHLPKGEERLLSASGGRGAAPCTQQTTASVTTLPPTRAPIKSMPFLQR